MNTITSLQTTQRPRKQRTAAVLSVVLALFGMLIVGPSIANGDNHAVTVSIAPVNLDGPAISDIDVTLTNTSAEPVTDVVVEIDGPINWTLYPRTVTLEGELAANESVVVTSEIHVPTNPSGNVLRTFTASASYDTSAGVRETATATSLQQTEPAEAITLAEARNNVGTTTVETVALGDYDGEGNTFSRELLAELGVTPGATLELEGATFTWPDVEAGQPDNVSSSRQTIAFEGSGTQIAVLGSGLGGGGVTGEFIVTYTDGSTSTGTIGFGNWFSATPTFDETVAYVMNGRNTPTGLDNTEYQYGIYLNSFDIDPTKTVESVMLPNAPALRIFDMAFVGTGTTPSPTPSVSATPSVSPSPSVSASPSVSPSPSVSATPSVSPSPSVSVTPSVSKSPSASPGPVFQPKAPYTVPGIHNVNGRQWSTTCEDYSQTQRCRTDIWATTVVQENGQFVVKHGWAFNNLTYLPYMTRAQWMGNPLGETQSWTAKDGRLWRTECDTAASGRNGCRTYTMTTVYAATPKASGGYTFSQSNTWVFNNIVMFSADS